MNYEKIKYNYVNGFWSAAMVQMAVRKGNITQEQADAIINGKETSEADTLLQEVSEYGY